jgi:hypothetical protein
MVDVLRGYGIILRTQYLRVSKDLFHMKYCEKIWTLNTTIRK